MILTEPIEATTTITRKAEETGTMPREKLAPQQIEILRIFAEGPNYSYNVANRLGKPQGNMFVQILRLHFKEYLEKCEAPKDDSGKLGPEKQYLKITRKGREALKEYSKQF